MHFVLYPTGLVVKQTQRYAHKTLGFAMIPALWIVVVSIPPQTHTGWVLPTRACKRRSIRGVWHPETGAWLKIVLDWGDIIRSE